MYTVWESDSLDWKGISAEEISSRVLSKVQPGSIVLFHNAAEHTPEALAGIIEAMRENTDVGPGTAVPEEPETAVPEEPEIIPGRTVDELMARLNLIKP